MEVFEMSAKPTFPVQLRADSGKGVARKLRQNGKIPAACYGHGAQPVGVTADPLELYKLLTGARRTNIVFRLEIEGGATHEDVMVRDYQIDPIRQELLHADFVVVDPQAPVMVTVPVTTSGRPRGVREGGRLQMVRAEVPITSRPADIPVVVTYDVTNLGLGETLLASNLELPSGVSPAYKVDYAVARIAVPRGAKSKAEEALEAKAKV
jgi:large subunit ribosomal protein L25